MDRPLGRACGNALEVEEAIAALKNEGPADLMEVTYALGAEMLLLAGVSHDAGERAPCARSRRSRADARRERFQRIIEAQGGNPGVVDDPALLPQARGVRDLSSRRAAASSRASSRRRDRPRHHRDGWRPNARRRRRRPVGRVRHHGATRRLGRGGRAGGDDLRARSRRDRNRPPGASLRHPDRRRSRSGAAADLASRDGLRRTSSIAPRDGVAKVAWLALV